MAGNEIGPNQRVIQEVEHILWLAFAEGNLDPPDPETPTRQQHKDPKAEDFISLVTQLRQTHPDYAQKIVLPGVENYIPNPLRNRFEHPNLDLLRALSMDILYNTSTSSSQNYDFNKMRQEIAAANPNPRVVTPENTAISLQELTKKRWGTNLLTTTPAGLSELSRDARIGAFNWYIDALAEPYRSIRFTYEFQRLKASTTIAFSEMTKAESRTSITFQGNETLFCAKDSARLKYVTATLVHGALRRIQID